MLVTRGRALVGEEKGGAGSKDSAVIPMPMPIHGTSGYAEKFSRSGPRDRRGRSLRELDQHAPLRWLRRQ